MHGTTIDHVLELEVVLSDGSRATFSRDSTPGSDFERRIHDGVRALLRDHARAIAEDYPRHWRQSGGYRLDRLDPFDLSKLIVGSEGTLAIVTAATVRLVELPKAKMFAVGHFDDLLAAIAATDDALALEPSAVELIDRTILELSRSKLEYRRLADRLEGDPEALLFVSFSGDSDAAVRDKLERLERAWREHGHGYHTLRAETAAEQAALTAVRKAGLGLLMAASEGRTRPAAFVEDTAVAPERLVDYVREFRAIFERAKLTAGFYGHCSVGCLHVRPYVDLSRPDQVQTLQRGRRGGRRARRVLRRRQLLRARRRARALAVQPAHLRRRALRRDARGQTVVRPAGHPEPGRDGRRRAADGPPARRRVPAAEAAEDALRLPRGLACTPPPTAASGSAPAARPAAA